MQKNRLPLIFTLIAISVLVLVSCGPGELGTEENPLNWGLVPSGESERVLSGFEEVADMIFEETGLVIDTFVATEYAGVIEAMCADPPKAHMASLATFAYIIASDKGCADVDLVSVRYGDPTYSGQIFVRADSGITSVAEAAGKTWCRADPTSTSSWVIPTIYLKAAGVDPDTDLAQVVDAGSHEAAVAGVYNGDCDLGASYIDARTRVEGKEGLEGTYDDIMDAIVIIETFSDIPNDGVQYVPSLDAEIREKITSALLAIAETEEGQEALNIAYQWNALERHDDTYYDQFRQFLDASGVNASDYGD
jgi:phosphonate transport system substrate-binding protein